MSVGVGGLGGGIFRMSGCKMKYILKKAGGEKKIKRE